MFYWLLAIDNAYDMEAKYIALLYLDLFKSLRLFSTLSFFHNRNCWTTNSDWSSATTTPFTLTADFQPGLETEPTGAAHTKVSFIFFITSNS